MPSAPRTLLALLQMGAAGARRRRPAARQLSRERIAHAAKPDRDDRAAGADRSRGCWKSWSVR